MSEAAPPTKPTLRRDLIAVRHSLVRHPVQGRASHQQLAGLTLKAARTRTCPEDLLEAKDRHLCQGASVILIISLPLGPPMRAQVAQVFIPRVTLATSIPMTPDARPPLRRDNRPRRAFSDGLVTLTVVIAAVARHLPQLARHLPEQVGQHLTIAAVVGRHNRGRHLACVFVHAQVQLAPRPPLRPAIASHLPLTLAVDFDARRVHHQVQRLIPAQARQRDRERTAAAAQGRVRGHAQRESRQPDDAAHQPFGGAQRQAVNLCHGRHAEDGGVGVGARHAAPTRPLMVPPLGENVIRDPQRQASTPDKGFVIVRPVADAVLALLSLFGHA